MLKSLRNEKGEEEMNSEAMKNIVEEFYQILYKNKEVGKGKTKEYIKVNNKIFLSEEQKQELESNITINKTIGAVRKQKSQKALGPDGIPAEYYIKMEDILLPPF